ncbi:hypothetical protein [Streptomyces sp. KR80]|uniref:hypothetical protein n=1 Tax=Streptomyces sp. KR80 TaxID=3457426 RepID=UPI003FD2BB15
MSTTGKTRPAASNRVRTPRSGSPWTVLRLHRSALWIWIAFVAITAAALLWLRFGPEATAAARLQAGCGTPGHRACSMIPLDADVYYTFQEHLLDVGSLLRNLAPVVAAWAAAALIGRELENRTAELAWTQSVSPARWLAHKLAVPVLFLAAGTALLVVGYRGLLDWSAAHHLLTAGYRSNDYYFATGPSLVAYPLLGLTLGALTAFWLRRALPALAVGAAATWVVTWAIAPWRTRIWPTVTSTVKGNGPWGFTATPCQWNQSDHKYSVDACLGAHPASQYWPVQLAETGFALALTALATAAAFWLLRRRTP